MTQVATNFVAKQSNSSMIRIKDVFNYCRLRHFKEIKYFSRDGLTMPNGIGFQRGNFIKECSNNANNFVLSKAVFGEQNKSNGCCGGVIILPTKTILNLNSDVITQIAVTISRPYSIGNAFRGRYIGAYDEIYDKAPLAFSLRRMVQIVSSVV